MIWPPDYQAEIVRRYKMLEALKDKPDQINKLMNYYRYNPIAWIEDWCETNDPRRQGIKTIPFILFPKQKDFIQYLQGCLDDRANGLVEKCRDVGATWLCCAFAVHKWLFEKDVSIGFGSRKEMLVDRIGDMDSIFEKVRSIIRGLPPFMRPIGFSMRQHGGYMKIRNPENGSIIKGESGDGIGRGGRSLIYFKDESAHYERPELIEAALGDNTDVQIDISSVNGTGNLFHKRRQAGELWYPDTKPTAGKVRVFIFDWRDHPAKTQAWYDARRQRAEDEGMLHILAQEVDRDYSSALQGIIIRPEWVRAAIDAHIKLGIDETGEVFAGQDVADSKGGDKNAIVIRKGVILKRIRSWGGDAGDAAPIALQECMEHSVTKLFYDSIGVGAGFKEGINGLRREGLLPQNLSVIPWNAAEGVLWPQRNVIPHDRQSLKNEDYFANMKAQAWWSLRTRFYKTYLAVTQGKVYPHDELISLPSKTPNLQKLMDELSQATQDENGKGKMLVDKAPEGTPSPNLADACVMAYFPVRENSGMFAF